MTNLLSFISSFGSSAELRALDPAALRARMEAAGLTGQEIAVILSGDRNAIAQMVKTSGDIVCCVVPETPEDDEDEQDDEEQDKVRKAV